MTTIGDIPVSVEVGTGNVRPLLYEIRHALERLTNGQEGTTIDLRRLPLAPGEEERIERVLGLGEVSAEVNALGPSIVQETSYAGVWLVTHKNAEGVIVARFIEVTRMPEILKSQREDIEVAVRRLEDQLEDGDDGTESARATTATG